MSGTLTRITVRALDGLASLLGRRKAESEHLRTGRLGEEAAYFHLRSLGYLIVARNYRSPRSHSELDLVGWEGDTLCFIEVKTRTTRDVKPAEAAVDFAKRRDLLQVAQDFLRKTQGNPPFRFDVVSVYFENSRAPAIELFKNAFRIQ